MGKKGISKRTRVFTPRDQDHAPKGSTNSGSYSVCSVKYSQLADLRKQSEATRKQALGELSARDRRAVLDFCTPNEDDPWVDEPAIPDTLDPFSEHEPYMEPDDSNISLEQVFSNVIEAEYGPTQVRAKRQYQGGRARADILRITREHWMAQNDILEAEYMRWSRKTIEKEESGQAGKETNRKEVDEGNFFECEAITFTKCTLRRFYNLAEDKYNNQALLRDGFLSPTPLRPNIAFDLDLLNFYRLLHIYCPKLGIQPFTKALCDQIGRQYQPFFRRQFSDAYDAYMLIQRGVKTQIDSALMRASEDWRVQFSCPACQYRLEGETKLPYDQLIAIDGNMSLKRFGMAGSADQSAFKSNYFLTPDEVQVFADIVKRPKTGKTKKTIMDAEEEQVDEDIELEVGGNAMETTESGGTFTQDTAIEENLIKAVSQCVEKWKANADDHKKGMWQCFDESGIFLSACRHSIILFIADMVASGELSKYPLSVLAKISRHLKTSAMIGHDIGCSFKKTAEKADLGSFHARFVVPAMHGYAHNRPCQLSHHPNYVDGTGLEDFETCERIFSVSNECARTTRYATKFHRHQTLDAHFEHWDRVKYAASGKFIFDNYKQALTIIVEHQDLFEQLGIAADIKNGTFRRYIDEESAYLASLSKEPEEDTLRVHYALALQTWWRAQKEFEEASKDQQLGIPPMDDSQQLGKRKIKPSFKQAYARVTSAEEKVEQFEALMHIPIRWTPDGPDYQSCVMYLNQRSYHLALDHMEKLVVQCLFELQKKHLESTGYKLRTQIAQHLTSRSKAIQSAVNTYNRSAQLLDPPRPKLTVKQVLNYSFVAEFDLLRDARNDIREKKWADPATRVLTDKYFRYMHAREEITRLNIEYRRLRTWIRDETKYLADHISKLKQDGKEDLACSVSLYATKRYHENMEVWRWLTQTSLLRGFTGDQSFGIPLRPEIVQNGHTQNAACILPNTISSPEQEFEDEIEDGLEMEIFLSRFDKVLSLMES